MEKLGTFWERSAVSIEDDDRQLSLAGRDRYFYGYSIAMQNSITPQKINKLLPALLGVLCVYVLGYAGARVFVFHAVEQYAGPEGKSGPRQDYIAKKGLAAGEGWEYQLFLPAIKVEESIVNYFHNL